MNANAHRLRSVHAARGSVLVSLSLVAAKGGAALLSGSLALWTGAMDALLDVLISGATLACIHVASRPADGDHNYGHGKIENLAALFEAGVQLVLCGIMAVLAYGRLRAAEPEPELIVSGEVIVLALLVVGVDGYRAARLWIVGRETGSMALHASAVHFFSDMLASLVIVVGLLGARAGYPAADAVATLIMVLIIAVSALRLGKRTVDVLVDTAPRGFAERICELVRADEVLRIDRIRSRFVGRNLFAQFTVQVSRTLPLARVEELRQRICTQVRAAFPHADIMVSVEPLALDTDTIAQRVSLIADQMDIAIHHLTLQQIGQSRSRSISADIEVPGHLSLREAHGLASGFEFALGREFGSSVECETHIEPCSHEELTGRELPAEQTAPIASHIGREARATAHLIGVHAVRVRETEAGLIVIFHCVADPELTVSIVHEAVDEVERSLRVSFPNIHRVVGHAEPWQLPN